jgi:hypothetical protein
MITKYKSSCLKRLFEVYDHFSEDFYTAWLLCIKKRKVDRITRNKDSTPYDISKEDLEKEIDFINKFLNDV